jgi:SPP1 gp7 family putative phage head morphogenesis protein
VRNQLNTTMEEGLVKGESIDELSDRVRGVFNNLGKYEAKRIAVTETAMAFNYARHETMKAAGVEYKSWLSSHGPNVRPAHAEAESRYQEEPIPLDRPFEVGGEALMYPADEAGSPENIINCQCIELAVAKPG